MEHVPSGNFSTNSAWLQCAVLAHNLIRWTATIGQPHSVDRRTVARTVRHRLIAIPGRLVNRAGTLVLRGPVAVAVGTAVRTAAGPAAQSAAGADLASGPRPAHRRRTRRADNLAGHERLDRRDHTLVSSRVSITRPRDVNARRYQSLHRRRIGGSRLRTVGAR